MVERLEVIFMVEGEGVNVGRADGEIDFFDFGHSEGDHEIFHESTSDSQMLVFGEDVDMEMGAVTRPEMAGE